MRIGPPTEHRAPTREVGAFVFRDPQVEKLAGYFSMNIFNFTFEESNILNDTRLIIIIFVEI